MKASHFAFSIAALLPNLVMADSYQPVSDKSVFVNLMEGRSLTNRLYNLTLDVSSGGQINGSALGWDVTGTWAWRGGYFCREMSWGGDPIPYNCQLVEVSGDQIRFTTDQGAGDSAAFKLR